MVMIFSGIVSITDFQLTRENIQECFTAYRYGQSLVDNGVDVIDGMAIALWGRDGKAGLGRYGNSLSKIGDCIIYGAVELHNRHSLQVSLGLDNREDSGIRDLDIVLLSFLKWGNDSFKRFIGKFSFIIWNRKRKVLVGIVDHLGTSSLYYRFIKGGYFYFSNRLRNLTLLEKPTINHEYTTAYLLNLYQIPGKTVFQEISAIPSGHAITVKGDAIQVEKYWSPTINNDFTNNKETTSPDLQLKHILFNAVRCRFSGINKIGILLSGGLDSSAIGCIVNSSMKEKKQLIAFSKILSPGHGTEYLDEREYISLVAEQEKLKVFFTTEVAFTHKELLHEYYHSQYSFPLNPFAFLTRPLYQMVSKVRCQTLFTGFGGDETVSNEGLTSLPFLLKQFSLLNFFYNFFALSKRYNITSMKILKSFVVKPLIPDTIFNNYKKSRGQDIVQELGNIFVHNEILQRSSISKMLDYRNGYVRENYLDPRKEMLSRVSQTYFRPFFEFDEYLLDVHNVNQVHPFLDVRIIEFILAMHPKEYLLEGMTRSIFRRAMKGVIPELIRWRRDKIPFNIGVPFSKCLFESKDLVKDTLNNVNSFVWEIVDRDLLQAKFYLLKQQVEKGNAYEYNRLALEIGRCINVAAFYQWYEA